MSLNNIGHFVIQIIAFYILKAILVTGCECLRPYQMTKYLLKHNKASMCMKVTNRIYRVFKWFNNLFNSTFYWTLLISMEVDLFLGGWIAVKSVGEKIPVNYFANVVVMLLVINYVWLIVHLFITHRKYIIPTKTNTMDMFKKDLYEKYNKGFLGMFSGFNPEFKYAAHLNSFYILKDMLVPAVLIFGVFSPFIQLLPMVVL